MKNIQSLTALIFLVATALVLSTASCKKDKKTESENITKVELRISGAGFNETFSAVETNGDGIWDNIDEIVLPPNVDNFLCEIFVYDETQNPVANLTTEIIEESVDHLFTYKAVAVNLSITIIDTDKNGAALGQSTNWATGGASNGALQVKLHHEPTDKANSADPGGDVDFEISFPVKIQ